MDKKYDLIKIQEVRINSDNMAEIVINGVWINTFLTVKELDDSENNR